jgi:hypothetical protein
MVISRMLSGRVAMIAIGPYKGKNILEMKTMDDSPGNPIREKTGVSHTDSQLITPKYCNKLTTKLVGSMILSSHQMVLRALGKAPSALLVIFR